MVSVFFFLEIFLTKFVSGYLIKRVIKNLIFEI